MKISFIIAMGLLLVFTGVATAEEKRADAKKPYEMKEMVVTAEKTAQPQDSVTQKVDVILAEEIENRTLPNRNLAEIFKYQPGTFVNPLSRNDANWGSYGGFGPKYNAYLLDGLPIDSFVDPMSLESIYLNRAELHRGPASIMYPNYMSMDFAGNQAALAGISNLITKERIITPMTRILAGYGTWNTLQGKLYHEGFKGNVHYFLGAGYEQSDYTNYGTNPSWLNMIDDPDYRKIKLFFKTTYFITPDKSKVSLFAHHTSHTGDTGRPNRGFEHQYDLINATYENRLSQDVTLNFKAGYRYYDRRWEEDNFPVLSLREKDGVKQNIVPADLSISWKHWKNSLLTVGTDFQHATYETFAETGGVRSIGNDMTARSHGLYAEEKLMLDNWVLRLGGRYAYTQHNYDLISGVTPERTDKSWDRFLWSAGARYNISPRAGVYANAGSSYIVPSAKSVGGTLLASDLGVAGRNGQLPNPSLKPEKGMSIDLGGDAWVFDNLRVGVRGFYTVVDDAIVENVVNSTPSQTQSVNAGKSRSNGVEFEIAHFISPAIMWFANATFTDTHVKNPIDSAQDGSDVPFVPNWIANVGFTAALPYEISISPYFQYVGAYYDSTDKGNRRQFGEYGVVNLKAKKGLFKTQEYNAALNLDVNNLFDRKYEMPWQFRDPGFNAMASIEIRF
ncbi:MAG: TonB-dependent receptor [Nitrospirae bacterium]|nr:MAG: TonB-dependent receptor [Nitrospirota bacterium]HSW38491.1 TonB-dependent receptor [Acidobacteriota bacterium]